METVVRVFVFYVVLLLGLRMLGKREFGQLSPFELVTLLLIPELVQQALIREDFSATNAMIALSTLFVLVFLTGTLAHTSSRFEDVLGGSPSVLVYNGAFVPENMARERVSPNEIYTAMRKMGMKDVTEVRWGMIERMVA